MRAGDVTTFLKHGRSFIEITRFQLVAKSSDTHHPSGRQRCANYLLAMLTMSGPLRSMAYGKTHAKTVTLLASLELFEAPDIGRP